MSGKSEKSHLERSNDCRRRSEMNNPPFCCPANNLFIDNTKTKKRGRSSEILLREGKKVVEPLGKLMASSDNRDEQSNSTATAICSSHGSISVIGRRRTMEDAVTVLPGVKVGEFDTSYDFFAVYDGHGGAKVSNACRERMHQLVAMEVDKGSLGGDGKGLNYWNQVMDMCFKKMDEEVISGGGGGDVEAKSSAKTTVGSTALVVLVGKEELVVANCGDSRAVLCRGGVAMALSNDHKPDSPDERKRVEAAGGRVIINDGSRVLGVLSTSRSIGDQYLKPFVISEPEISVTERTESDDFVVIATDGLWDFISNEVACEVVKKCLDGRMKNRRYLDEVGIRGAAEAAALLAELAMARGSKDNISVIVIELKNSK